MNKKKLAKNAKAITKAGGKFALKGIKYAGIGVLGATDLAARGVNTVAAMTCSIASVAVKCVVKSLARIKVAGHKSVWVFLYRSWHILDYLCWCKRECAITIGSCLNNIKCRVSR